MLLSIYCINTIVMIDGSYNNNNIIVNNYNIVYANSLTNNRVLYIDNSGKLNTTNVEPNTLNKIDTIENNVSTIQETLNSAIDNINTQLNSRLETKQDKITIDTELNDSSNNPI